MRYLFILTLLSFQSFAAIDLNLQNELQEMAKADQQVRESIGKIGWDNPPEDLVSQMREIDASNTQRLKKIIKQHSWVTADLVGETGVSAAFLIIQHSPDAEFQEQMLPLLEQSYLNGEGVTGQEFALLTDRVLVKKGEAQIYGTQLSIIDGKMVFDPIADEQNVDIRRAEVGMPPLLEYKKLIAEVYNLEVE